MLDTVINVENLSKKYILKHQLGSHGNYKSLRENISGGVQSLVKGLASKSRKLRTSSREEFWALNDVSFTINQGDTVGVIGRNGAGKSTLLKVLSQITEPTKGRIAIRGRVASLLEVGTGFHPELTGRENIFLNGAVLGMSKSEIVRKFDEIVAFAEVEKFLDTPVKRYSSGMYVRLAFSVAAHLEPEILVVDEVLAVGDLRFQKKCLGRMKDVGKEGRTVIFVSHNMAAISTLCSKGIVLEKGKVVFQGGTQDCISVYEDRNLYGQSNQWLRPSGHRVGNLAITQVESSLQGNQPDISLFLKIHLKSTAKHSPAFLAVDISDSRGTGLMQAIPQLEGFIKDSELEKSVGLSVDLPPLIPGSYLVTLWVGSHNTETLDEVKEVVSFEINESPTPGRSFPHTLDHGFIVPNSTIITME